MPWVFRVLPGLATLVLLFGARDNELFGATLVRDASILPLALGSLAVLSVACFALLAPVRQPALEPVRAPDRRAR